MTNKVTVLVTLPPVKVTIAIRETGLTGLELVDYLSEQIDVHLNEIKDGINIGDIQLTPDDIEIDWELEVNNG
jgi:hypothetical protein